MGINSVRYLLFCFLFFQSYQAWSYSESCQLVAQMAGNKEYKQQPLRIASMSRPQALPSEWQLELIENHGAWYVYQTQQAWLNKFNCAPMSKVFKGKTFEFMPVVLNNHTGHNAVVTGAFIIKTYRKKDLENVIQQYGFTVLSPLPNPKTVIVDVKPVKSYDLLLQKLDRDKNVVLALPLLSEPR